MMLAPALGISANSQNIASTLGIQPSANTLLTSSFSIHQQAITLSTSYLSLYPLSNHQPFQNLYVSAFLINIYPNMPSAF
jgi:hypothetical protein